ncbi:MAG: hypothetical protein RR314_00535 [Oscillospiraceae bacterium]
MTACSALGGLSQLLPPLRRFSSFAMKAGAFMTIIFTAYLPLTASNEPDTETNQPYRKGKPPKAGRQNESQHDDYPGDNGNGSKHIPTPTSSAHINTPAHM